MQVELCLSEPQLDILQSTCNRNLMHCGVGSGKTFLIGLIAARFVLEAPQAKGFIAANTYSQLSKSTLDGVFKVWENMFKWKRGRDYCVDVIPPSHWQKNGAQLKAYDNTITFPNGGLVFTASLDNYKVIDGTEFAWACLDETKDTKEQAVREVITARLRQGGLGKGFNPLYIFTSPAKTQWLAEWFNLVENYDEISKTIFSETDYYKKNDNDKLVVISSTYHNKHNLSEGYIERLIQDNAHNKHRLNMLIYGSPLGKADNQYYTGFDRLKHVKQVQQKSDTALHLAFDFNRRPYITLVLFQVWHEGEQIIINAIDEICLTPPNNTTEDLCRELVRRYNHLLSNGCYIYGDYSGKSSRTNSAEHDYTIIEKVLFRYIHSTSNRVAPNKPIIQRKEFMNKIFFGSLPITYTIDPKCKHLITDCEFLQEATDGTKHKAKATDEDGNSYEKYGHTADAQEYFFTQAPFYKMLTKFIT